MALSFSLVLGFISLCVQNTYSYCDNYYQSSDRSSSKRPFDTCFYSEIDGVGRERSYQYICNDSTSYGNNSVNGFTAFLETYNSLSCEGEVNRTQVVLVPYIIFCGSECEVMKKREYHVYDTSGDECLYNESKYVETTHVLAMCDNDFDTSDAYFCNDDYYWKNFYYESECDTDRIFQAEYYFKGCDPSSDYFLELIECDFVVNVKADDVNAFDDALFVGGFALLIIAILFIVFILIWYCCWYKKGFTGKPVNVHQSSAPAGPSNTSGGRAMDDYDNENDTR